ncbi:MAG: LysR family transcriptional regulator [Gluconacetobacter diazotrophicus]|nr:LysR family transcriptional regulator [Gluconacetobacter diazotrophicus]
MPADLSGLAAFLAVAETLSFRAAAERLGVSRSAVSQSLRQLEDRLGVALVHRTTRSVRLSEAGSALHERTAPALAEVDAALAETGDDPADPHGTVRIAVSSIAERFLAGPLLAGFLRRCPRVRLDITVTDAEFDIVSGGFDAGVRLGEVIDRDMIAVPVSGEQRQMAVAAPAYLAARGIPAHPRDLLDHACIGWRPAPDLAPYRWEFEEHGRPLAVDVTPVLTTNDMGVMLRTALAGGGVTFGVAETFQPFLDSGALAALLVDHCPPFPGFFLYFPSRRHLSPKLRALVDHVRWRPDA